MVVDAIFLYTDGATEATNAAGELYGENRLLGLLNGCPDAPVSEICELVKADVAAFAGNAPEADDITMLCLSWDGKR